jgi:hypothetical protein
MPAIFLAAAAYNRHRPLFPLELRPTMNAPTNTSWRARLLFAGIAGALTIGVIAALPSPAQARVWVSVGGPCCGWYGPGAYYGYGYYPPYYYGYGSPGAYYAPPYPQPAAPAPSAYAPQSAYPAPPAAPSAYTPQSAYPPPSTATPGAAAAITYTSKPAFTNAAGQPCRQYMANAGSGQPVYGTACRMADGQWRVVD